MPIMDFDLPMLRNRVFREGNVHIFVVPSCVVIDLMVFRNYVFELRNLPIWTAPNYMGVYLLIVRNGVSSHTNPSYMNSTIQKNGPNC